MSLLLALTAAEPPVVEQPHGGVTRRVRSGRVYEKFDPVEPEEIAPLEPVAPSGPNELLFAGIQARQAALLARVETLQQESAEAQAKAAVAKAAQDVAKAKAARQRAADAAAEMARIAQEIEEMDVAYIVALMD